MKESKSKKDVGLVEDAMFFLTNCIASESHALFSYLNTKDEKWLDALNLIRNIRVKILDMVTKNEESQLYCFNKHLLAMSMGISEVGNRYLNKGDKKTADELFEYAGNFQALFLLFNDYGGKK